MARLPNDNSIERLHKWAQAEFGHLQQQVADLRAKLAVATRTTMPTKVAIHGYAVDHSDNQYLPEDREISFKVQGGEINVGLRSDPHGTRTGIEVRMRSEITGAISIVPRASNVVWIGV